MSAIKLECSIWTNGETGWGLKVLGGLRTRLAHFDRKTSPVVVEIDGIDVSVNIDKNSFWTPRCGELIRKPIGQFAKRHRLKTGDRVWLEVIDPKRPFRLELN